MNLALLAGLAGACAALILLERAGLVRSLQLTFKGDIKRETGWLAQYGQGVCTVVAALLLYSLDPAHRDAVGPMLVAVFGTAVVAYAVKRITGRVRPNREGAGRFLGFTLRHQNWRESFPSSHSASAVALSVFLSGLYPQAAAVFWGLAIACALLRFVLDAHWLSDVLGGVALGYAGAMLVARWFGVFAG